MRLTVIDSSHSPSPSGGAIALEGPRAAAARTFCRVPSRADPTVRSTGFTAISGMTVGADGRRYASRWPTTRAATIHRLGGPVVPMAVAPPSAPGARSSPLDPPAVRE